MGSGIKRSDDRILFYFKTKDTAMTVQRKTLQKAAADVGLDETAFLHFAAARLIASLNEGSPTTASTDEGDARHAKRRASRDGPRDSGDRPAAKRG